MKANSWEDSHSMLIVKYKVSIMKLGYVPRFVRNFLRLGFYVGIAPTCS